MRCAASSSCRPADDGGAERSLQFRRRTLLDQPRIATVATDYLVCALTLVAITIAPGQAALYLKFWRGTPDTGRPADQPRGAAAAVSLRLIPLRTAVLVGRDRDRHVSSAVPGHGPENELGADRDGRGTGLPGSSASTTASPTTSTISPHGAVLPFAVGAALCFLRQAASGRPRRRPRRGMCLRRLDRQHTRSGTALHASMCYVTQLPGRHALLRGGRLRPCRSLSEPVRSVHGAAMLPIEVGEWSYTNGPKL